LQSVDFDHAIGILLDERLHGGSIGRRVRSIQGRDVGVVLSRVLAHLLASRSTDLIRSATGRLATGLALSRLAGGVLDKRRAYRESHSCRFGFSLLTPGHPGHL